MKKVMSLISGLKSSKSSELTAENLLLVVIQTSKTIPSIGMHGPKLIKRKPIINSALLGKLKLMNKSQNQQKFKDKLVPKWKNKVFLLTKEQTNLCSQTCILTAKCGKKEETKRHYSFRD